MGRYEEKYSDSSLSDLVLAICTGGLSAILDPDPTYECKISDKETGKEGTGYGHSKREAHANAWKKLKK